ncbi:MAG: nucleoside-diphosphate sugar epimerase/dehydratase [Suipraeoptans sp.]
MKNVLKRGYYVEARTTLMHTFFVAAIILELLFVVKTSSEYSRLFIVMGFIIYLITTYTFRVLWKIYIKSKRERSEGNRRILIISNEQNIKSALHNILNNNYSKFQLIGVIIFKKDGYGDKEIDNYIQRAAIDEVYIDLPKTEKLNENTISILVDMGITVHRKMEEIIDVPGRVHDITRMGNSSIIIYCALHINQIAGIYLI